MSRPHMLDLPPTGAPVPEVPRITAAELTTAAALLRSARRHGYSAQSATDCARVADLLDAWARGMRPPKWAADADAEGARGLGERGG